MDKVTIIVERQITPGNRLAKASRKICYLDLESSYTQPGARLEMILNSLRSQLDKVAKEAGDAV